MAVRKARLEDEFRSRWANYEQFVTTRRDAPWVGAETGKKFEERPTRYVAIVGGETPKNFRTFIEPLAEHEQTVERRLRDAGFKGEFLDRDPPLVAWVADRNAVFYSGDGGLYRTTAPELVQFLVGLNLGISENPAPR